MEDHKTEVTAIEEPIKDKFPEKKAYVLGYKGAILDEVKKTMGLLGDSPKEKLTELGKQGLTDEDIARKLSTEENKVHSYSIFCLRFLLTAVIPKKENYGPVNNNIDRDDILSNEKKDLIDTLEDEERIIYVTRLFRIRPMNPFFLARDLNISRQVLAKKEAMLIEKLKKAV